MRIIEEEIRKQEVWRRRGEPRNEKSAVELYNEADLSVLVPRVTAVRGRVRNWTQVTWMSVEKDIYKRKRERDLEANNRNEEEIDDDI